MKRLLHRVQQAFLAAMILLLLVPAGGGFNTPRPLLRRTPWVHGANRPEGTRSPFSLSLGCALEPAFECLKKAAGDPAAPFFNKYMAGLPMEPGFRPRPFPRNPPLPDFKVLRI